MDDLQVNAIRVIIAGDMLHFTYVLQLNITSLVCLVIDIPFNPSARTASFTLIGRSVSLSFSAKQQPYNCKENNNYLSSVTFKV